MQQRTPWTVETSYQHNGKRPSALNVFWNILALNLKEVYCIVSTFDILIFCLADVLTVYNMSTFVDQGCKWQAQMKLQRSVSFFFFFFYLHIPGHLHMVTVKDSPGLQS